MDKAGFLAPKSDAEARERFAEFGQPACEITRVVARGLQLKSEEYHTRVTEDVIQAAQEALFGSLLTVYTGTIEEFEEWYERDPYAEFNVYREGSDQVSRAAWHPSPLAAEIVVATYEDKPEAAVSMLRRISWSRVYRPILIENAEDS